MSTINKGGRETTQKWVQVETEDPKREYTFDEKGDVVMTETQVSKVTYTSQQFRSFLRQHENNLENIDEALSEEFRKKQEAEKAELKAVIDKMKPFADQADEATKEIHEQNRVEQVVKAITEEHAKNKTEQNPEYIVQLFMNMQDDRKQKVLDKLSTEDQNWVIEMKRGALRAKRSGERKKKLQERKNVPNQL